MAEDILKAKCILLAIHYASEGNIKALRSLTRIRSDDLDPELILRILLTYLPESIEPKEYTAYVGEVCSRGSSDNGLAEDVSEVDTTPVKEVNDHQAKKRVKRLKLLDVRPPNYPQDAPDDVLTQFLYHRAYRIDEETGLINLIPQLIQPFLAHNDFIRAWYIGVLLPLLRLQLEYYPEDASQDRSLAQFEKLDTRESVDFLMHNVSAAKPAEKSDGARDIKGLVGPWMYGNTERKRRKLSHEAAEPEDINGDAEIDELSVERRLGDEWEYLYSWMVAEARQNFPLVTEAVENWDGPSDVDLGGLEAGHSSRYLDEETQADLEKKYMQAAFACCYVVESDSQETIYQAHGVLARLARLLDYDPPPDLNVDIEHLPRIDSIPTNFENSENPLDFESSNLLKPNHPLTTPRLDTYTLLQMLIYSAYQFSTFNYPVSVAEVANLRFTASAEEQLGVLKRVLRGFSIRGGGKRDETQWSGDLAKLSWLRTWGTDSSGDESSSAGVLGKIPISAFEEENLKCLIESAAYNLAINLYIKSSEGHLSEERIEQIVLTKAMEAYDSATNGNRTRGGMKKANDM